MVVVLVKQQRSNSVTPAPMYRSIEHVKSEQKKFFTL